MKAGGLSPDQTDVLAWERSAPMGRQPDTAAIDRAERAIRKPVGGVVSGHGGRDVFTGDTGMGEGFRCGWGASHWWSDRSRLAYYVAPFVLVAMMVTVLGVRAAFAL